MEWCNCECKNIICWRADNKLAHFALLSSFRSAELQRQRSCLIITSLSNITYNNENFHTLCYWVSSLRYLNCSIYCAVFHEAVSSLILKHSITHTATLRAIISVYGNITLLLWIFHSFLMQLWWVCWSFVVQMWVQRVAIVTWKPNDCCTFNFQQSFSRFLFKTKAIKNNNVIISLFHGECIKSRL